MSGYKVNKRKNNHRNTLTDNRSRPPSTKAIIDGLTIFEQIAKIISYITIPIVLTLGGWGIQTVIAQQSASIQTAIAQQSVSKDYVQLAVGILTEPKGAVDAELRDWAVDLLNENSPLKFSAQAISSLKSGDITLPESVSSNTTTTSSPSINNFSACPSPCNGSNATREFASGINKVYAEWDYKNIPYGARYIRKWTMDGKEWIRYDCTWTGNENGHEVVKLTEPKGLHSGVWEATIIVDNVILLQEQIKVVGNWDFWEPAGIINSCYGTTD